MGYFFPSYDFDLDNTLYMFTSGRYEYLNKGMDLTIEALARLNHRLRESGSSVTVVFFIITKAPFRSINVRALQSRAMLREFRTASDAVKESVGDGLFLAAASGEIPDLNTLMDDYWRLRLRRAIQAWKSEALPGIVTHDLHDDAHDPVLNQLRTYRLFNLEDDPVKVVFHPDFVLPRRHNDFHRAADELTDRLFRFASLNRRERVILRNSVEAFSEHFDWDNLGRYYNAAHDLVLERGKPPDLELGA